MERVIKKIFGENVIDEFLKKRKNNSMNEDGEDDYLILLDQIEDFKIGINADSINNIKRINCTIFENFINKDISGLIEKYNSCCPEKWKIKKYKGFKIHFPYQIMIDLTKDIIVDNIVNYIHDVIEHVKNINSILYV